MGRETGGRPEAEESVTKSDLEGGSDIDAEGEEDDGFGHTTSGEGHEVQTAEAENSDVDAEGEEVEDELAAAEPVGAVKISEEDAEGSSDGEGEIVVAELDRDVASESESEKSVSSPNLGTDSSDSGAEGGWEGESASSEEAETEIVNPNLCVFCGQDEENDPSEEFEDYLACAVCGDNAHRQCARHASSLHPDDDPAHWRCRTCVEHGLEEESKQKVETTTTRRRSSIPKITRDLLPAYRGAPKPDAHSVFNTLVLPDDPLDGSRSLRKRKQSSEDSEQQAATRSTRKRRKASDAASRNGGREVSLPRSSPNTVRVIIARANSQALDRTGSEGEVIRGGRPSRLRRSRQQDPKREVGHEGSLVVVERSNGICSKVIFRLSPDELRKIKSRRANPNRNRRRDRTRKIVPAHTEPEVSHYPSISTSFNMNLFGFQDRETDESKSKPYGGILTETEADTSKTFPQEVDRRKFEAARQKAEEDWKAKMAAANLANPEPTRTSHKVAGPPSKIKCINFGGYEIDTWHAAPYPEEYSRNKVLYICEFCLKYMNSDYVAWRHKLKCPAKHPPGDEIYRDGRFSFFEVDGRKNPVYCQNLCLLAKLFLGSKTLYYDVEPFLFYVMTENNEYGCHFVGYFSKEKRPSSMNNVSCILVLPIHQRKGFGHMLIEFSYLLTRVEKKTGSPEKPLSDMGLVSYRSYWRLILCYQLLDQRTPISIAQISERTGMTADDIVSALEGLRALVRDPVTKTYALRLDYTYFKQYIEKFEAKNWPKINPDALVWTPYVMGRNNSHYEDGPAIHTVAQREDEEEDEEEAEEGAQPKNATSEGSDAGKEEALQTNGHSEINGGASASQGKANPYATSPSKPGAAPSFEEAKNHHPNGAASSKGSRTPSISSVPYIPPTRYEVYPPIPGNAAGSTTTRRRYNRPFGSRRRPTSAVTPLRRSNTLSTPARGMATRTPKEPRTVNGTVRRTRSKLAEAFTPDSAHHPADEEVIEDDDEGHDEEEVRKVMQSGDEADADAEGEQESPAAPLMPVLQDEDLVHGDDDIDAQGEADVEMVDA